MAEADLDVTYDGPALVDGRMEVRDLAPALLALAELVRDANAIVNPNAEPVTLEVRATEQGSFTLHLALRQADVVLDAVKAATPLLTADPVAALVNLQALLFGTGGLVWLIKNLRGRRPVDRQSAPPDAERGSITLVLDDGTTFVINRRTDELLRTPVIRKQARDFVRPLARDGIASVSIRATSVQAELTISADDVEYFEPPEPVEEQLLDDTYEWNLQIVNVAFVEGNKWRFSDGDQTFYAAIEDTSFLARVDQGSELFAKGDVLRCRVRVEQKMVDGRLVTERAIEAVLQHRHVTPEPDLFGSIAPDA